MNMIVAVALGGAIGAVGRFLVGRAMLHLMGPGIPWGTLMANLIGAFLIGFFVHLFASRFSASQEWQGFVVIGVLGGFTTFSAFSLELALMIERDQFLSAASYALCSIIVGVAALFFGMYIARSLV